MSDQKGKTLDLSSLIPERDTFKDDAFEGDAASYEFKPYADFTSRELVEYHALQDRAAQELARVGEEDQEVDTDSVYKTVEDISIGLLLKILPDLPEERAAIYPYAYRKQIMEWWRDRQPKRGGNRPAGNADAG